MKEHIAIMADSTCDLPAELVRKYGIKIVPLKVIYPDRQYSDRVDIQPDEVYARMPEEIPTTSMPSVHEIKNAVLEIQSQGYTHLIIISISSGLSGTYSGVKMIVEEIPDMNIYVFDSKTLSMGTGWMVLETARYVAEGHGFAEAVEFLQKLQPQVKLFYVLETLEYLRKGGRIGTVAAMLGEFLHFKPIISVNKEGQYYTYCKARGRSKSISKLMEIIENSTKHHQVKLAIMYGGAKSEAEKMWLKLKELPNIKDIMIADISPVLGVHTGPGLLGICYYEL